MTGFGKKGSRRWTALCVVAALCSALVFAPLQREAKAAVKTVTSTDGQWFYAVNVDATVSVYGYLGDDAKITVPEEIDGQVVTAIGEEAFSGSAKLTSVTLKNNIVSIGDRAFEKCTALTEVTMKKSVLTLGSNVFSNCTALTDVTLSASLTALPSYTFNSCESLAQVELPAGITNIGACAFYGCTALTEITLPDSVLTIDNRAFSKCTSLRTIVIPSSVLRIGDNVFEGISSERLMICTQEDSYAYSYAQTNGYLLQVISESASDSASSKEKQTITVKAAKNGKITKKGKNKTFSLSAATSGDGKLTYKSSNKKIVKVNASGKVTTKGYGTAKITITAKETDQYQKATKTIKIVVKK